MAPNTSQAIVKFTILAIPYKSSLLLGTSALQAKMSKKLMGNRMGIAGIVGYYATSALKSWRGAIVDVARHWNVELRFDLLLKDVVVIF